MSLLSCWESRAATPRLDRVATVMHLANIARRVGGRLEWDPASERFTNSGEANGHLDRERRKGYELPEG